MDWILNLDYTLFTWINSQAGNGVFDNIMPVIRNKYIWTPLYIFLIAFMAYNFKGKGLVFILFAIMTVSLADIVSSHVIKKTVKRPRPCRTEVLAESIEVRAHCGSGYSFTSSHATNHMALATFIFLSLGGVFKRTKWFWILWALSIGYAQIYVGVHFPLDVFAGFLLGYLIGFSMSSIFERLKLGNFTQESSSVPAP